MTRHAKQSLGTAAAERLAKILGLLGSSHAGERAAAGAKAHSLVHDAGLTWLDVVMPSPSVAPLLEGPASWRLLAAEVVPHMERLAPKEAEFVATILAYRREPSAKQLKWLNDIHTKVCGVAA